MAAKVKTEAMTFGEKVKDAREDRGWSQDRLSKELGVHNRTVQKWERGSEPGLGHAMAVAALFGWSLADLRDLKDFGAMGRYLSPDDGRLPLVA